MSSAFASKEIDSVVYFPTMKTLSLDSSTGVSYLMFKDEIIQFMYEHF